MVVDKSGAIFDDRRKKENDRRKKQKKLKGMEDRRKENRRKEQLFLNISKEKWINYKYFCAMNKKGNIERTP